VSGNDDAAPLDFFLFERLNQHAIAERFHIDCHMSVSSFGFTVGLYLDQHASAEGLYDQDPNAVSDRTLECFGRGNNLLWPTGAPSLIIRSMPWATSLASPRVV
jgi:hypothetical protein